MNYFSGKSSFSLADFTISFKRFCISKSSENSLSCVENEKDNIKSSSMVLFHAFLYCSFVFAFIVSFPCVVVCCLSCSNGNTLQESFWPCKRFFAYYMLFLYSMWIIQVIRAFSQVLKLLVIIPIWEKPYFALYCVLWCYACHRIGCSLENDSMGIFKRLNR